MRLNIFSFFCPILALANASPAGAQGTDNRNLVVPVNVDLPRPAPPPPPPPGPREQGVTLRLTSGWAPTADAPPSIFWRGELSVYQVTATRVRGVSLGLGLWFVPSSGPAPGHTAARVAPHGVSVPLTFFYGLRREKLFLAAEAGGDVLFMDLSVLGNGFGMLAPFVGVSPGYCMVDSLCLFADARAKFRLSFDSSLYRFQIELGGGISIPFRGKT